VVAAAIGLPRGFCFGVLVDLKVVLSIDLLFLLPQKPFRSYPKTEVKRGYRRLVNRFGTGSELAAYGNRQRQPVGVPIRSGSATL
jgi:hypothetical protein